MKNNNHGIKGFVSGYMSKLPTCFVAWLWCTLGVFAQTTNYDFNLQTVGSVYTTALQNDRKILVGDISTPFRLLPSGVADPTFTPRLTNGHFSGICYTIGAQEDGKILVGGQFTSVSGQAHTNLARFNADGSLDTNFNIQAGGVVFSQAFDGNGGKVIGGSFPSLGGQPRSGLGRITAQDVVDVSFTAGLSGVAFSLAVQADGRIIVGGYFQSLAGQSQTNLGRLKTNSTLDTSFPVSGLFNEAECFACQADGKILVGTGVSGPTGAITNLARFNVDGSLDTNFSPFLSSAVDSIAVQTDGKIIVGGYFTNVEGQARGALARLNPDGSLDTSFVPIAYERVNAIALQDDGKILIGGRLVDSSGQTNSYFGRLQNTDAATQNLTYDGSTVTWMRGGTSPEVWSTRFQTSIDGIVWTDLGQGTRIGGGWQQTGVSVLPGSIIRAQGLVSTGQYNGTSWFVESKLVLPANPRIIVNDGNFGIRSNQFGFDLVGPSNATIVVESSSDLSNWVSLVTNTVLSSPIYFSEPVTASKSFYRLRLLQ